MYSFRMIGFVVGDVVGSREKAIARTSSWEKYGMLLWTILGYFSLMMAMNLDKGK